MGLGCQGLLPPILYPLAMSLSISVITYSWSSRSICWKVHLLKPDPGFVWITRAFLAQSLLCGYNHKAHWGWQESWLSTMLFPSLGPYGFITRKNTRLGCLAEKLEVPTDIFGLDLQGMRTFLRHPCLLQNVCSSDQGSNQTRHCRSLS